MILRPFESSDFKPFTRNNINSPFPIIWIPITTIRRSWDRRIYIMGISILVRRHLYTQTPTWWPHLYCTCIFTEKVLTVQIPSVQWSYTKYPCQRKRTYWQTTMTLSVHANQTHCTPTEQEYIWNFNLNSLWPSGATRCRTSQSSWIEVMAKQF